MVSVTGRDQHAHVRRATGLPRQPGNLFAPASLNLPVAVTTVPTTAALNTGVRAGGGSTIYFVFPQYGQISWTCTGGTVTGVEIQLWGR
jgi:hypothetical protein